MKTVKYMILWLGLVLQVACSSDAFVARGDRLLAVGDLEQAQAVYQRGLHMHPTSTPLRMRLVQAQSRALDGWMAQVEAAVDSADFARAQDLLAQARAFASSCDDPNRRDKIDWIHDHLAEYAQRRAKALQSQGDAIRAVALAEAGAKHFGAPADGAVLQAMRVEGIARYRRSARNLMQSHPGSAALQLAMAGRLGDTDVQAHDVSMLWQRFTKRACYHMPSVDVRIKSGTESEAMASALRLSVSSDLDVWRSQCGRGTNPLRVSVEVASIETDDRSVTVPGAMARPGSTALVEDSAQVNEPVWDTITTQITAPRLRAVTHRDCRDTGSNHQLTCSQWRETVQRPTQVERLKVIQRDHMHAYPHALPHVPESEVVRFERGIMSRRMIVRGYLQVGADAPQAFAVTVVSEDAGHPEIRRDDVTVPADPLVLQDVTQMVHNAAQHVADLAVVAAREATFEAAATMADRAADLSTTDPEAAEELYLQTLGAGWDGGHAVRTFFLARYGMPADEVLACLNRVLGRRAPPPGATSTADLALFYPRP